MRKTVVYGLLLFGCLYGSGCAKDTPGEVAIREVPFDEINWDGTKRGKVFYDDISKIKNDVYMIGETLSESEYVAPYYAGLPAMFDFSSWWRMEWALNNDSGKWYPKDLLEYEAQFANYRSDYIHANELSNHDEDRTGNALGGNIDKMKMAAKILLTFSGSPYLYYGEEIGMLGLKQSGDQNVRDPFLWNTKASDSFRPTWRTSTFSTDATVRNLTVQQVNPASLYNVYKKFIQLRNADPVLAYGTMQLPDDYDATDQTAKQVMAFYREYAGKTYLILHNLSATQISYAIAREVKRGIYEHHGTTITQYEPNRYNAAMPAYSTIICEI